MLEKARYLSVMRKSQDFKSLSLFDASKEIAKITGSRSPYVRKMLISYNLYEIVEDEKFYQIDSDGMKKLNEVLGNEVALAAFKSGVNIDTAYELTNDIDLQFERKVKKRFGCFREKA
jgi:hypothetical protein